MSIFLRPTRAVILATLLLASCASTEVVENFARVREGMTEQEVIEILGTPSSRWALKTPRDDIDGERLQWGDSLSSLASSRAFAGEPDRAYAVVFDASGKVVRTSVPEWVSEEVAEAAILRERRIERDND